MPLKLVRDLVSFSKVKELELPRSTVIEALAGGALLLLAAAGAIYASFSAPKAERWVAHGYEVKGEAAQLLKILADAETGERGYLLTGKEEYLEPYKGACEDASCALKKLRSLTSDNSSQQLRLDELSPLVDQKFAELRRTISLWRGGSRQEALAVVNTGEGQSLMETVRDKLADFQKEEDRLLAERKEAATWARYWLLGLILASLVGALISFIAFFKSLAHLIERLHIATTNLEAEVKRRREAELMLVQVQKLEAIGQLTGGIAHDFNNLLTVILGGLDTLKRKIADAPPIEGVEQFGASLQRPIDMALEAGQSGAKLVRQLLTFARRQTLAPEPLDLNRLVASMSDMLRRTLGEDIAVQSVLAGGLWRTFADANQIESALLNLAVNARDAMPEGGHLTIETSNTYLDDAYAAQFGDVRTGQYVC
ncbi:MAG TPA: CHASE3 domain-containing protein [Methylocella sp.]|nr:CHASE3 domain-containing protein [Methylocella sp.]